MRTITISFNFRINATFNNAIIKPEMPQHQDRDIKLLVGTCICEITQIAAPEAPYSDVVLKEILPHGTKLCSY